MDLTIKIFLLSSYIGLLFAIWNPELLSSRLIRQIYVRPPNRAVPYVFPVGGIAKPETVNSQTTGNKFYAINEKHPERYVKYAERDERGKLSVSTMKCCGKDRHMWMAAIFDDHLYNIQVPSAHFHAYRDFVDAEDDGVKPVTEHIEDDLKYDFRTNTHSIR